MRILGVDPGLKATGYGLITSCRRKIELIEAGTIEPSPKDLLQNRLFKVHMVLGELMDQYQPQVLIVEKLYAHTRHPITASILGHVRGVICLLCAQKRINLVEHSPKRIRKAITGNGNASKAQVRSMIAHQFSVDERTLALDASDALALALGYLYMRQNDCSDRWKAC